MIRASYQKHGVSEYYKSHGDVYRNPHEQDVANVVSRISSSLISNKSILDLCAGSGEVSIALKKNGLSNIIGCDPYTHQNYKNRTGNQCLSLTFDDISSGALAGFEFGTVICSYALHLLEASKLPIFLFQLSNVTEKLVIITPNKKPEIKDFFQQEGEFKIGKALCRTYVKKS